MTDLWDRFFNKAEEAKEAYDRRAVLLQKAHDLMDDWNARSSAQSGGCWWCNEQGYDGDGLKHKDNCILVLIRKELG